MPDRDNEDQSLFEIIFGQNSADIFRGGNTGDFWKKLLEIFCLFFNVSNSDKRDENSNNNDWFSGAFNELLLGKENALSSQGHQSLAELQNRAKQVADDVIASGAMDKVEGVFRAHGIINDPNDDNAAARTFLQMGQGGFDQINAVLDDLLFNTPELTEALGQAFGSDALRENIAQVTNNGAGLNQTVSEDNSPKAMVSGTESSL